MAMNRRHSSRRNKIAPLCVVTRPESEGEAEGEGESIVSLVHQAASRGDTRQLVQVVQRDPSLLEQPNADGMTPLGQAVMSQQMTAIKRLVKMGADINAQDGMGRTSLSIAAYQGWQEGVVYLLRNGARQTIADKTGRLPLHAATYHSDPRTLVTLLQSSSSADINQTDHEQMTAIHWAAFHKRPEHVRCLIERGASLLLPDMDGKLPLHWAAQNGCRETCRLLLHASLLRRGQGENSEEGVEEKCREIAGEGERDRMLTAHDHSGKTAMHFAAAAGHAEVIRQLAFYMACHPDCPDPDDRTPLHWAAAMGHAHCVKVLLDLGVKVNIKDVDGGTPLTYAKQSAHDECVHLLEEALHIPAGDSSNKKMLEGEGGGGGKRGKTPLEFLKGLFLSPRKDNGSHTSTPSRLRPPPSPLLSSSPRPLQSSPSNSLTGSPVRALPSPGCCSERFSLPSIHTKTTSLSDGAAAAAAADPGGNTVYSLPFDVNTKCVEPEQAEDKKPVKGEKVMKYRTTHIPALPPLLPDLAANADPAQRDNQRGTQGDNQRDNQRDSQQESGSQTVISEGELSAQDLGPLRWGPPPQIRQLNTRAADSLHDGMRSVIDLRPAADCQYSFPRPPDTPAVSQGMKGSKKRGLPAPPNHHSSSSHQSSGDMAGSEMGLEGMRIKAEDIHQPQRGGHRMSSQLQGVVAPSSVSTPHTSGVPVVEGSSVLLSHSSRVTLPHCSSGPLLQDSSDPPPRSRVSRSDSSRCQQARVTFPQCPNVSLTQGNFGAPSARDPFIARGSSSVPVPKDSSAGPSFPHRSSNSRELVIDDISNTSSLPNLSPSLSCPSSSVSLVGKDRSSGTCQKSDLKLVDI